MKSFNEWLTSRFLSEENLSRTYDRKAFVNLPWDWNAMIKAKVLQPLFYYAKENYVDGKPEVMDDNSASIITLPNLKSIDNNELSSKNIHMSPARKPTCFSGWEELPFSIEKFPKKSRKI